MKRFVAPISPLQHRYVDADGAWIYRLSPNLMEDAAHRAGSSRRFGEAPAKPAQE